eukprot:4509-Chlamydomonas_euryale.AAC.4
MIWHAPVGGTHGLRVAGSGFRWPDCVRQGSLMWWCEHGRPCVCVEGGGRGRQTHGRLAAGVGSRLDLLVGVDVLYKVKECLAQGMKEVCLRKPA